MAKRHKYWKTWEKEWNRVNRPRRLWQLTDSEVRNEIRGEVADWQDGVWQYIADHTTPSKKGCVVRFIVSGEDDFWWRVEQRKKGNYLRNDVDAVAKKVESLRHGYHVNANIDRALDYLRGHGPWYIRLFLRFRSKINTFARGLGERHSHVLNEWYQPITRDSVDR